MDDIQNLPNEIKKSKWFKPIDPTLLTKEEMLDLGFKQFESTDENLLIPFWLFPYLADNFDFVSIRGNIGNETSKMDKDHRYGLLAYKVKPKQK